MEWTFLDTWIVVIGVLGAMSCALLGNYLVLRRMSMMGDAISHAVLPGLAIAFLVSGSRESLPMLIGAILIGVLTTFFIHGIDRLSGLDRGASMGVVFTTLFALGLILIRQAADHVDLDPGCVLYGAIELTPLDTYLWFDWEIPQAALTNGAMLLISLVFAAISALVGHIGAITIPKWFGFEDTSTAGLMAFMAGVPFCGVLLFAPRYGLISRLLHQLLLGIKIVRDDILGFLYRYQELASPDATPVQISQVRDALKAGFTVDLSLWDLARRNMVKKVADRLTLTRSGLDLGANLVRSHRLWETYLCNKRDIVTRICIAMPTSLNTIRIRNFKPNWDK